MPLADNAARGHATCLQLDINNYMIIYKTVNLINKHYYIGKDQQNNPTYLGSGLILAKAIKKYGKENFIKEILEECDNPDILAEREKYWIAHYNAVNDPNSYNIAKGGHGGHTGAYHKVGLLGNKNPMFGKTYSDEERDSFGERMKAWHRLEDPIKKSKRIEESRAAQANRPKNPESVEKMRNSKYHTRGKGYGWVTVYTLISPNGETFVIKTKDNLKVFCKKNGLSIGILESRIFKGVKMLSGCMVGWTASRSKEMLLP